MSRRVFVPLALFALGTAALFALAARTQPPRPPEPLPRPLPDDVRYHGAKGDGTADDWQALQAAVDGKHGTVRVPKGTYRVTKTVVIDLAKTGHVAIKGEGGARVVMAGEGPAFKFVGTHAGTAAPNTVKAAVWNERMPLVEG